MKKGRHFKDNSKLTNGMSGKAKVTQIGLFSTVIIMWVTFDWSSRNTSI